MRAKRKAEKAGPRSTAPPYVLKVPRSSSSVSLTSGAVLFSFLSTKCLGSLASNRARRSMESGPQGLCRTKVVSKYFGYGWTTPSLPTIEIDNAPRTSTQNQANHARKSFNKLLEEKCGWLSRGIVLGLTFPSTEQEDRLVGEIRDRQSTKEKNRVLRPTRKEVSWQNRI